MSKGSKMVAANRCIYFYCTWRWAVFFQLGSCCNRNIILTAQLTPKPNALQLFYADFRKYSSCNLHPDIRKWCIMSTSHLSPGTNPLKSLVLTNLQIKLFLFKKTVEIAVFSFSLSLKHWEFQTPLLNPVVNRGMVQLQTQGQRAAWSFPVLP